MASILEIMSASDHIEEILQAAAKHDNELLEKLLKQYAFTNTDAVDVQNTQGVTPLHAAISSCIPSKIDNHSGESHVSPSSELEQKGCDTVRLLLENGAIWNQLDHNGDTPGCIAHKYGLLDLYELMVDAGVRAEVLLNRLEGYELLEEEIELEPASEEEHLAANGTSGMTEEKTGETASGSLHTKHIETTTTDVHSSDYLSSNLTFDRDRLLDSDKNGVMMAWESDIMKLSSDVLLDKPHLRILNIGAGMLIFDTFVQNHKNTVAEHHIVEAHSDVLDNLEAQGWDKKSGVTIHPGKWQDILPELISENKTFDAIYYDTFAESYSDFREFFTEYVIGLLEPEGKWSFFNGMGADRQISYDVYQKVAEIDLLEAGFDVEWLDVDVPDLQKEWLGVKRAYWNISRYRLPICKFVD